MNLLAQMWAANERKRLEMIKLHRLAKELRKLQTELAPKIAAHQAAEWGRKRQDGPQGFVMVRK
jgi:hypothetical protein